MPFDALERYRLSQGELSEKLDALNATSIKKAPRDVITGAPLKYQRITDGRFKLYSIGWNEVDDGAVVATNKSSKALDSRQGDWVWPSYPAK